MLKPLLLLMLLPLLAPAEAQDYIITWKNDTLHCEMPGEPRKKGLRPVWKYKDGYYQVAAIFPGDSIRVYEPGQIRGYYRKKHGDGLLCDGNFHSIQVPEGDGFKTRTGAAPAYTWRFLLLETQGEYVSMYKLLWWGRRLHTTYYAVKHQGPDKDIAYYLTSRKRLRKVLADEDIREYMLAAIQKTGKYKELIAEYNRLKAAAAVKP